MMRATALLVVVTLSTAHADDAPPAPSPAPAELDVCKNERLQEEKAAYERCMDDWRDLLPSAHEELLKPPPERVGNCDRRIAQWQATAGGDPTDYDVMMRRLAAREAVESCARNWWHHHPPPAEQRRRDARALVVIGSLLLGSGGLVATGLGAAALADPRQWEGPIGGSIYMIGGAMAGASIVVGTVMLSVGGAKARPLRAR